LPVLLLLRPRLQLQALAAAAAAAATLSWQPLQVSYLRTNVAAVASCLNSPCLTKHVFAISISVT
jgi:hypothetical protein